MSPRVDAHNHIIDPGRFPFVPGAGYTPASAREWGSFTDFDSVLAANGISHALLVQPSCYGTDNRAMLDAIARSGGRFRGIAVVETGAGEKELDRLAAAGIVGVRFNMMQTDPDILARPEVDRFLARVRERGWFLQIFAAARLWAVHAEGLAGRGLRVLVDHWGAPDLARGVDQPGFAALLRAAREAGTWSVKISAPYRLSKRLPHYEDLDPYLAPLVEAFGADNCVWGSDWPYLNTPLDIRYGDLLAALERWFPDEGERARILWDNPARLFGFAPPGDGAAG